MKIRYKILLILTLILIILVTTFLATANSVMYNSIRQDENQNSIKNIQRFEVNLNFLFSSIQNNVNDCQNGMTPIFLWKIETQNS